MTIHRYEVTDAEWAIIEPMLPKHHMGRPQKDLRAHFNGYSMDCPQRSSLGRPSGKIWAASDRIQLLLPLA